MSRERPVANSGSLADNEEIDHLEIIMCRPISTMIFSGSSESLACQFSTG